MNMPPREPLRSFSDIPAPHPRADAALKSDMAAPRPRPSSANSSPAPGPLPEASRVPQTDSEESDVAFAPGSFSPEDAIDEQIADLENWARSNVKRDRSESVRFWILRGSAFLSAVLAAAAPPFGFNRAGIALGACAALFIAIDSAWPGASLRNSYRRAVCDLRQLQGTLKLRWDKVRLAYPNPNSAKRVAHALALLDAVQAKREEISKYLGNAEPSRGVRRGA
jgi:hypothetical protein